ncbi:hypothetical protein GDO81_003240 [Engystomops pustulosus]|uniref:Uncharacterized protein n=1 Tax=Engystomops pustulosus TaxID=76066 RepID=A0AAV6ZVJ9_ENGPU|nr:hypothetical protein GDO81_003240 [Engystomops pustulosus]
MEVTPVNIDGPVVANFTIDDIESSTDVVNTSVPDVLDVTIPEVGIKLVCARAVSDISLDVDLGRAVVGSSDNVALCIDVDSSGFVSNAVTP